MNQTKNVANPKEKIEIKCEFIWIIIVNNIDVIVPKLIRIFFFVKNFCNFTKNQYYPNQLYKWIWHMPKRISEILYIFLASLFSLWAIILVIQSDILLNTKIFYAFVLLIFPFFDIIIDSIQKNLSPTHLSIKHWDNFIKYTWIVLFIIITYFSWLSIASIIIFAFILFNIFFSIDTRFSFFIALSLLIFTSFYLLVGDQKIAESLSIYAYYFLILGVLFEIKNYLFSSKNIEKSHSTTELIKQYRDEFYSKISEIKKDILKEIGEESFIKRKKKKEKNKSIITKLFFYFTKKLHSNIIPVTLLLFSVNIVLSILYIHYNIQFLLQISFLLLFLSYFYSKIVWAKYSHTISSSDSKDNFFFNKAIFFASLWLFSWYLLFKYLKIQTNSNLLYFITFLVFLFSYYAVFSKLKIRNIFNLKQFFKKHIYIFLNLSAVILILWILWFQWWVFTQIWEWYKEKYWYSEWNLVKVKKKIISLSREEKKKKAIEAYKQFKEEQRISEEARILEAGDTVSVKDVFIFQKQLHKGSVSDEVRDLEIVMKKLWYFEWEPDRTFWEQTKASLTQLLQKECWWPETTQWIFWAQARECLYNLKIRK